MSERKYVDADLLYYNAVNNMRLEKSSEWQNGYAACLKQIQDAHAADVEEIKHGEWIRHIDGGQVTYECPECTEEFAVHNGTQISDIHYCPNCGAKMNGKENDK